MPQLKTTPSGILLGCGKSLGAVSKWRVICLQETRQCSQGRTPVLVCQSVYHCRYMHDLCTLSRNIVNDRRCSFERQVSTANLEIHGDSHEEESIS